MQAGSTDDRRNGENERDREEQHERTPSIVTQIVIVGGGPAGYESALVAAQIGAEVTLVEDEGPGGACVLYGLRAVQRRSSRRARR